MPDRRAGNGLPLFALTVLLGGLAVGSAVVADSPAGQPSLPGLYPQPFADVGDDLRAALVEPLGAGVWVFLFGWLAIGVALVRGRRWLTCAGRILGWAA